MIHPGLPLFWVYLVWLAMLALVAWSLLRPLPANGGAALMAANWPALQGRLRRWLENPWPLRLLKILMLLLFGLIVYAGLVGTLIPERNLATVLTWNIWWAGLVFSVFFLGSAWCAVCPWNTLALWLVRPRWWWWRINNSLQLTPPPWLRTVWPASLLLIGLSWLELGVGITTNPRATAWLALLMVLLAVLFLALYRNQAFCQHVCPVGRTVGFYAQLAAVELRPLDNDKCARCTTLACYNGSAAADPCPTQQVMGRLRQNTYCTSCGNCVQSCPEHNIAWRLRPPAREAMHSARPRLDEAMFMLVLLALTSFHGVTMMTFWEDSLRHLAQAIGDSGQLLASFSLGLALALGLVIGLYTLATRLTRYLAGAAVDHARLFTSLAFATLPLAFSYHLAHNLNHLVRESAGIGGLLQNPLGLGALPLSDADILIKHLTPPLPEPLLFSLQALFMLAGFWFACKILRQRSRQLYPARGWQMLPLLAFIVSVHGFHLWMLSQPMVMRMSSCVLPVAGL